MRSIPVSLFLSLGLVVMLVAGCGDDDPTAPPATGVISILPVPTDAEAPWHLTGPSGFALIAQGDTTLTGMSAGEYTLVWSAFAGWSEPDPATEEGTLLAGGALEFVGQYTALLGDIAIETTPPSLGAPWRVIGPQGFDQSGRGTTTLTDLPVGNYTLTWVDVVRWSTPDPSRTTQQVRNGATTTFAGVYVAISDDHEPNDVLAEASFVGGPLQDPETSPVVLEVGAVFLDVDDKDFYSFSAFAGVPIAARVEPLAGFGVRDDARNLGLRLWRRISAEDGTWQLLAQIDFNGAGEGEYHPPIPYNQAGFLAFEVYSTDSEATIQPYRLRIANVALTAD